MSAREDPPRHPGRLAGVAAFVLLLAGGLLVLLGSFAPELDVIVRNALHGDAPVASPDRSHWVVFRECVDMLSDPDLSLGVSFYVFYAVEAAGLGYLAAVGLVFAASACFVRSRAVTVGLVLFHSISLLALSAGAFLLSFSPSGEGGLSGKLATYFPMAGILLAALASGELALGWRALRQGMACGLRRVDAANLLPAVLLLLVSAALFASLVGHPNWPATGYLMASVGALLVLGGMLLRRRAPAVP